MVLQRKRFRFVEVPCRMRPRRTGRSTITAVKSLYYMMHVLLGRVRQRAEIRRQEKIGFMDRLLNVMTIFSVLLIGLVLASVRRAHIRVEYSVSWLAGGSGAAGAVAMAGSADLDRRHALGLNDAPLALLMVAGAVFLVVLYRLSLMISRLKDSNIALAQRVAILEFRLEALHEKAKRLPKTKRRRSRLIQPRAAVDCRAWWIWCAALLGLFLVFEVYGPALNGAFVLDDRYSAVHVPEIKPKQLNSWIGQHRGRC